MDGLVIVALPLGNKTMQYKDGDVAKVHQTILYLGDAKNASEDQIYALLKLVNNMAEVSNPIMAKVIGFATLGEMQDEVVLTESEELTNLHDIALTTPVVKQLLTTFEQHPNWISHITGLNSDVLYGDIIVFDRLALWYGDNQTEFSLNPMMKL